MSRVNNMAKTGEEFYFLNRDEVETARYVRLSSLRKDPAVIEPMLIIRNPGQPRIPTRFPYRLDRGQPDP
jgi:hypothetical protein